MKNSAKIIIGAVVLAVLLVVVANINKSPSTVKPAAAPVAENKPVTPPVQPIDKVDHIKEVFGDHDPEKLIKTYGKPDADETHEVSTQTGIKLKIRTVNYEKQKVKFFAVTNVTPLPATAKPNGITPVKEPQVIAFIDTDSNKKITAEEAKTRLDKLLAK